MDLVDRYLNAIHWNLPQGVAANDVLAELRDVITSRIEDREEALGRPLTRTEIATVLREFGHPLVVAARYGSQQWLIGPDLFPFYWFALKVVLAICALILVVSAVADAVFSGHPMRGVMHGLNGAWWSLLGNAGLVTLIFAIIERTGWLTEHLTRWSPERLPDLADLRPKAKRKSSWEAVFEIAVGIGLILWWTGLIPLPIVHSDMKGLTLIPDPIWAAMWWPILALLVARLAFNLIQWLRSRWQVARVVLSVATAAGTIAVLALIHRAGHWLTASSTTLPAARISEVDRDINLGIHYAIIVTGVIIAFQCAKEIVMMALARR